MERDFIRWRRALEDLAAANQRLIEQSHQAACSLRHFAITYLAFVECCALDEIEEIDAIDRGG